MKLRPDTCRPAPYNALGDWRSAWKNQTLRWVNMSEILLTFLNVNHCFCTNRVLGYNIICLVKMCDVNMVWINILWNCCWTIIPDRETNSNSLPTLGPSSSSVPSSSAIFTGKHGHIAKRIRLKIKSTQPQLWYSHVTTGICTSIWTINKVIFGSSNWIKLNKSNNYSIPVRSI